MPIKISFDSLPGITYGTSVFKNNHFLDVTKGFSNLFQSTLLSLSPALGGYKVSVRTLKKRENSAFLIKKITKLLGFSSEL
jgi:hypothetical protein